MWPGQSKYNLLNKSKKYLSNNPKETLVRSLWVFWTKLYLNLLPDNKILDWFNFKEIADGIRNEK